MMNRRRFLTISAACTAMPLRAHAPLRWQGIALGAEVSLELNGPEEQTRPALETALAKIRHIEKLFSLYDPASLLVQLNQTGYVNDPPAEFLALFHAAGKIHEVTEGLFDPTVQPLWMAHARGEAPDQARDAIGWRRVSYNARLIQLAPGQALTFNGIAQGYATDLVTDLLHAHGLVDVHVNIGEHRATGAPRRLALEDPVYGQLGSLSLDNAAIATSSPEAMRLASGSHILSPAGHAPLWSTGSVEAENATFADGLSTALCLADLELVRHISRQPSIHRILLVDDQGDLVSL